MCQLSHCVCYMYIKCVCIVLCVGGKGGEWRECGWMQLCVVLSQHTPETAAPCIPSSSQPKQPAEPGLLVGQYATALYDFQAESDDELSFEEDDVIALIGRIDEHWLDGSLNGKRGIFPEVYVEVIKENPAGQGQLMGPCDVLRLHYYSMH